MNTQQKMIYGAVMALAIFFVLHLVLAVGSLLVNLIFAIAMGVFAVFVFTVAVKLTDKKR